MKAEPESEKTVEPILPAITRVSDVPLRCSMDFPPDPRHQPEVADPLAAVKLSVRAERLADLERQYAEGQFGLFDYFVVLWHRMDPDLYTHLPLELRALATTVLYDEGLL